MKKFIFYTSLLFLSGTGLSQQKLQEINPVLHDQSYVAAFGTLPDASTNEMLRIQTHLSYVEQLLRNAPPAGLTNTQQANRSSILDILHQYMLAGKFPVNRDYPGERRPCFIDADGNICAVGYLVEQTKGREIAEEINAEHQYDFIADMNEPVIEAWAKEYGLTLEECAMIQPAYGPPPSYETSYADIKTGYGISSGVIGGVNIAITLANLSNRYKHNRTLSYMGLIAGTGQVILGAANIKKTATEPLFNGGEVTTSYKNQNNLSYANIALGTTTIVTSTINLVMNKKSADKRNVFNLYSYPNENNSVTMGLSFTRRI
ncbi:MAG TPA: hypothetical protein VIZ28_15640 [Chitinophagaceae bacterium]